MEQENNINRTNNILDFIQVACFDLDLTYKCLYLNKGAEALISVTRDQALEKNLSEFFPVALYEECFTIISSAVFSKKKQKQSVFFKPAQKWLSMEVIPDSERILLLFTENINEQLLNGVDHNESQIQTKRLLVSIMNSSIFSINVYKSIRNEVGKIIDFEFMMISELTQNITGLTNLPGKRLLMLFPQIIEIGLFDKFVQVVENDVVLDHEENLNYIGSKDKYIRRLVMKLNDGFITSWIDISKQKLAEQDRSSSLTLLKQAEELAQIGSWEFDVLTGDFLWSDGMYHLFGFKLGIKVKPEVYLQQVVSESKDNADRLIANLKNSMPAFEETLKIRSGNQYKIIKVKANTIFNENDEPIKVLGVDIDITDQVRLHEKNSRLSKERRMFKEKQQQEVFKAILKTQQEERKRIAEGLHNGLGQHLYGVKLSLSKNIMDQAPLIPFSQLRAMKQTEKLLADVIMEARKLSHELMPSTLEDF
jgi:two-component system NarL family sensor kinase